MGSRLEKNGVGRPGFKGASHSPREVGKMVDVGINTAVAKPVEVATQASQPKKADVAKKEIKVESPTLVGDGLKEQDIQSPTAVSTEEVKSVVSTMDSLINKLTTELRLEVDEETNQVIVKIIDGDSQEVIRQIPAEEFVALSKRMRDAVGMLFDRQS
jgi:flagellar protein FlaG